MPLALFADLDTTSPKQWYVHADHLNRPAKMTDASQAVVWDAYYWPYGEVRAITGSASNNLRFPGQYFLVESGLHYNWHRHYDPTIGRYTQADPIGLVDGPSLYTYARSAPASIVDPDGREAGPYAPPPDNIPGGPWKWTWDPRNSRGGAYVGPDNNTASWDPEGHWDCNDGKGGPRQRYDFRGNPLTKEQAHKPPWFTPRLPPWPRGPLLPIPIPPVCAAVPEACGLDPNKI